ncbi:hypothetical protein ACH41H_34915 [Streptomyces sp. NPDC020800]
MLSAVASGSGAVGGSRPVALVRAGTRFGLGTFAEQDEATAS